MFFMPTQQDSVDFLEPVPEIGMFLKAKINTKTIINIITGSSVLLSSAASVFDDSAPRCRNLSSTESIFGVTSSYLESFCKKEYNQASLCISQATNWLI